jgi:DNA-directed RNA polymerase subunit RPC12/RpoP
MKCPNCSGRITTKDYDPDYEIYECPKCGEAFEPDDIEEAQNGTSPRKRRELAVGPVPQAKGKKRQAEIVREAEALAKFEAKSMIPIKKEQTTRHRDEVSTRDVIEIIADEIQAYTIEMGGTEMDRLNAREFFAMNLVRPLLLSGVSFREKEISRAYCTEHKQ